MGHSPGASLSRRYVRPDAAELGVEDLARALEGAGGVHVIWSLFSPDNLHSKFDHLRPWFGGFGKVRHSETPLQY